MMMNLMILINFLISHNLRKKKELIRYMTNQIFLIHRNNHITSHSDEIIIVLEKTFSFQQLS